MVAANVFCSFCCSIIILDLQRESANFAENNISKLALELRWAGIWSINMEYVIRKWWINFSGDFMLQSMCHLHDIICTYTHTYILAQGSAQIVSFRYCLGNKLTVLVVAHIEGCLFAHHFFFFAHFVVHFACSRCAAWRMALRKLGKIE